MRQLLLWAILAGSLWLIVRSLKGRGRDADSGTPGPGGNPKLVRDPICKTYIPKDAAVTVKRGETVHYFCSDRCAAAFDQENPK